MTTKEPDIKPKYANALDELTAYIFAPEDNLDSLDVEYGSDSLTVDYPATDGLEAGWIDPYDDGAADFMDMLLNLDAEAYGAETQMDNWVMLDAGVLPGAVIGFGKQADKINPGLADKLDVPHDYDGLVPVTESAGAFDQDGTVIGHTFAAAEEGKGHGTLTAVLRAEVYPTDTWKGVIQWDNVTQMVYTKLGTMTIESASLPCHSLPDKSLVYQLELDDPGIALEKVPDQDYDLVVGKDDTDLIDDIQDSLDEHQYEIVPPGAIFEDGEPAMTLQEH